MKNLQQKFEPTRKFGGHWNHPRCHLIKKFLLFTVHTDRRTFIHVKPKGQCQSARIHNPKNPRPQTETQRQGGGGER